MIERMKERAHLVRPLLIPLVLYIGLLAFSINWLETNLESSWRIPVSLLPMVPGVYIAFGVVRAILQIDELQRKILLEGIAISFSATLVLLMSLGLLGIAGVPQLNEVYIALFMVVMWLIGKLWATRRYE
jgi:uncharacterized membrane protein (DUF485 family)